MLDTMRSRWVGGRRIVVVTAACIVAAALVTFVYSRFTPGAYTATLRISLLTGGPDSALFPRPVPASALSTYAYVAQSRPVVEAAVQRIPPPPSDKTMLLQEALGVERRLTVTTQPATGSIIIRVRGRTAAQASRLAAALGRGFLQFRGAQQVNIADAEVAKLLQRLRALPQRSLTRADFRSALRARLASVINQNKVVIVRDPVSAPDPALAVGIAVALSLLVGLGLLGVIARRGASEPMLGASS